MNFSQDFALFVTSISAIGISYLITLVWKFHKSRVDKLKLMTFKNVDGELESFERLVEKMNSQIKLKIKELEEKKASKENSELIEKKVKLLNEIIESGTHLFYVSGTKNKSFINKLQRDIKNLAGKETSSIKSQFEKLVREIKNKDTVSNNVYKK
ncbi:hypothetical protein [Pontimicrobium sp. MEBiC01747]